VGLPHRVVGRSEHGTGLDQRAVEPLIAGLDLNGTYQTTSTRTTIIDALAAIADPRAVEPLLVALKDQDAKVRQAAATALVVLFQSGTMAEAQKAALLAQREVITMSHADRNYGCPMEHADGGIGVDFPI
jgi:HEAT repeat protein